MNEENRICEMILNILEKGHDYKLEFRQNYGEYYLNHKQGKYFITLSITNSTISIHDGKDITINTTISREKFMSLEVFLLAKRQELEQENTKNLLDSIDKIYNFDRKKKIKKILQ